MLPSAPDRRPTAWPPLSFFGLLAALSICLSSGYGAAVLGQSSWAETQQLSAIFPYYHWQVRAFTAAELAALVRVLGTTAVVSGLLALLLAVVSRRRATGTAPGQPTASTSGWREQWRQLSAPQQRWAVGTLGGITLLRVIESIPAITPAYDDAASYSLFVSRGILAVSCYYPVPNNHVLSNALNWLFFQVYPGFWWSMRLPVVLAATLATGLLFAGLLRARLPFRAALLAIALFSVSQLSLYHAAVGRGYWLLTVAAVLVFFSSLALSTPGRAGSRRAWLTLVAGGILGTGTVPTFAVVLFSAYSWLAIAAGLRREWAGLLRLTLAGLSTIAGTLLFYTPLMFVSGIDKLFGNGFVAPQPWPAFITGLPHYLWETEGFLAGQITVGALLTLVVLGASAWLLTRLRRLPAAEAAAWQRLGPVCLWFMGTPYALLAAQRVFAPSRTLLYKGIFFYVLLALCVEHLLRPNVRSRSLRTAILLLITLGWGGYQLRCLARDNRTPRLHNAAYHEAITWLSQQAPGEVLVPEPIHGIYFTLFARSDAPHTLFRADAEPRPGRRYRYVVGFPNHRGYFQPRFPYPPAYRNPDVEIYEVAPDAAQPSAGPPTYWHVVE